MKKGFSDWSVVMLGTLILMMISFYNGYPLVYSDTGTYLYSGFDHFIPVDRPITYGLFVFVFSLKISLWTVVFVQNLITSYVLFETCKFLIRTAKLPFYFMFIMMFLTLFTGIGWYSNQIMPDFFAPVLILTIFLLIYNPSINVKKIAIYSIILIYSLIVHFSHFIIASILIAIIAFTEYVLYRKRNSNLYIPSFTRICLILSLVLSAWILLPTINLITEKKFIFSKGSHAFLMAHLVDTGVLNKYLKQNCNSEEYRNCKLCQYKDSLPKDLAAFLWDSKSPFHKTGGWINSQEEYNKIIYGMLKKPKYLTLNIFKSFIYGCDQLFKNEIGQGLSAYNSGSAPYGQMEWRFPAELNNYSNARQNIWNGASLNLQTLNLYHLLLNILSVFSLLVLFYTSLWKRIEKMPLKFLTFAVISIVVNAFVMAGLNAPCERFQARVVWLLPFALFILVVTNIGSIKSFLKAKIFETASGEQ